MTQAYFLVPGLLLDEAARNSVSKEALVMAGKLSESLAGEVLAQELSEGVFSRSVHYSWLWSVLMRRALPAQTAAYAWPVDQGPQLCSNDVFGFYPAHMDEAGVIHAVDLTDEAVEKVALALTAPLNRLGFMLQRWDRVFYLTRKNNWGVALRPFKALVGYRRDFKTDIEGLSEACEEKESQRQMAADAVTSLEGILREANISANGLSINALWMDGASRYANVYPPTLIRSVLSDDDAIIGWGLAAGILNHRLAAAKDANQWPSDVPSGECIAVIETLYDAWLMRDWKAWEAQLPNVVEQIQILGEAARKKGCDQALIVACGNALTVSIPKKLTNPKSLLARLGSNKKIAADAWLFCGKTDGATTSEAML